ncbi:AcrR family transcriptional regulator [Cryobacterium mesophilum]|nr:TetR/AcrR family transcriptional regulator [Terrimesophilobacter mesophilus]MBB5633987.1 AcrR family transcriptional regulator [Terrimesophilobacter mesophilus]
MHITANPSSTGGRARPLSVEDRQAMIIDAVIPLLAVHGRDLTSKQIAEAAGVAEGTIFRAFGDKDSLITAAVERFLDPEPMRRELRAIDPSLDLHAKVLMIITVMQTRFSEIFRIMALVGHERPPHRHERNTFIDILTEVLGSDLEHLNWPASRIAHIIRLMSFASAFPQLNDGMEFTPDELTTIVLHGIAGSPQHSQNTHPTESQD